MSPGGGQNVKHTSKNCCKIRTSASLAGPGHVLIMRIPSRLEAVDSTQLMPCKVQYVP